MMRAVPDNNVWLGAIISFAYAWWKRLTAACEVIRTTSFFINAVERDPDANKLIECAVDGHCRYIVSQDLDLLDLGSYAGIQILKVGNFLRLLETLTPPPSSP